MTSEPTVFIVDDDPTVRKTICALVESVDLKAQAYATAQEFLETYDPACPACLVIDVRLPGMSGLELLEHLREKGATIPVIMMSGDADAAFRPYLVLGLVKGCFSKENGRPLSNWMAARDTTPRRSTG